jgi:flagellar basal-body rod modification protein FlgD
VNVNSTSGTDGTGAPSASPVTSATSQRTLGQDAFLTLLVTQLENQDPTSPKEDTEFIAQLAVFSQLEKLTEISASLKLLTEQLSGAPIGEEKASESTSPAPPAGV